MHELVKPQVFLVGKSGLDEKGFVEFIRTLDSGKFVSDADNDIALLAETAGRMCYMSFGTGRSSNAEHIRHIIESGHGSVLEHVVFNFIITGVSRGFSHELVRHRIGVGYSQLSTRYVNEADANFVMPPIIDGEEDMVFELAQHYAVCANFYEKFVEKLMVWLPQKYPEVFRSGTKEGRTALRKAARGAARASLPIGLETRLFFTANVRALRHIIKMRTNRAAEIEIRIVAGLIFDIVREECPVMFEDFTTVVLPDGSREIQPQHLC